VEEAELLELLEASARSRQPRLPATLARSRDRPG
jgi:hypothetical protein